MRKSLSHRANFLATLFFLFLLITIVFSLVYRILEVNFTREFLQDIEISADSAATALSEDLKNLKKEVLRLVNFIGDSGTFARNEALFTTIPVRGAVGVEIFAPDGEVLKRFYRSGDYQMLMGFPEGAGGSSGLKLFSARGKLFALFWLASPRGEGISLNLLAELDADGYLKKMRELPVAGGLAGGGEVLTFLGDREELCSGCHVDVLKSYYFPMPHPGFVKEGRVLVSGSVRGKRYMLAPIDVQGLKTSFLVFSFGEGEIASFISNLQSILFPSWLLTVAFALTGLTVFYGSLTRPLRNVAALKGASPEEIDRMDTEGLPDEIASVLGRMKELRDRLISIREEYDRERSKFEAEMVKQKSLGEDFLEKIKKINEFIRSISTIMYPEVLGERIVGELMRLVECEIVLLAVEGVGSDGEAEVFVAHRFRKDSVSEIFIKKMEKEFREYSKSVNEIRDVELIDDPFFSRFSVYHHRLERVFVLPIRVRDVKLGTIAFFRKGRDDFSEAEKEFIHVVSTHLGTAIENSSLHEEVKKNYFNTIRALVNAIEEKDRYTRGHSERVTRLALAMGEKARLSKKRLRILYQAAVLHDIGKIGIDLTILNKKGRLSEEEMKLIRQHPVIGQRIIEPLTFLKEVKACIKEHHERYDGKGYPHGLKRDELTLEGRILAVADAFDAMTSDRPYRKAMTEEEAIEELRRNAGGQFDPYVVELFLKVYEDMKALRVMPKPPA